jgi:pyruvate,water dikinase
MQQFVIGFGKLDIAQIDQVGGKNASLGEMIQHLTVAGVQVPHGFATTADAYRAFLEENNLDHKIKSALDALNVDNVNALAKTGRQIRQWIEEASFGSGLVAAITQAYNQLCEENSNPLAVAVRSSATAEDLPDASFAGQQETFLNVRSLENVLKAIKHVFASLFNDRAISYRAHHGFDHHKVALSAGIQRMVRSDQAASGVMFTLDTESGFQDVVFITASYGLGEPIVQGAVNPDEFYVYKPNLLTDRPAIVKRNLGSKAIKMIYAEAGEHSVKTVAVPEADRLRFSLTDDDINYLAKQAVLIEQHYGRPMDIEWAKDGVDGQLYILQARPETVKSRAYATVIERYQLKQSGKLLTSGRSIGQRIGSGTARVLCSINEMERLQKGDVLVADMTDPDWEPIMKKASAIVTNRGGRTCHAAIIARELGIPAVVGCGDATQVIEEGEPITVSCAEGETGFVYKGLVSYEVERTDIEKLPELPFKVMLNIGNPEHAFSFRTLPNAGIGLARLEFIISQMIGIHPKALLNFSALSSSLQKTIVEKTSCYGEPIDFYVQKLAEGIATLACAFYPKRVIVRLSDFKSNEYANLLGGEQYEPHEENPMIGFRGASRYVAPEFQACFALECKALRYVRDVMGFTNVEIMVPFVRTLTEAKKVIDELARNNLRRGENGLRLIMMCEVPSNALLAEQFLEYFDGFSIGSNDLTQLTLGLDRDSGLVANQFDERDPAVKLLLQKAIQICKKTGKYIGICGQGPSDHADFAKWLMEEGIESVSLNPDSVVETILFLAKENA